MTLPRLTIVTPSLNQGAFIERTINSVLNQCGDFDLEYLVMDGGSRDQTRQVLERYAGQLHARIEQDRGQADAVNKGLRAATGDILGWVNSDDVLLPGALDAVARAFATHSGLGWLHGRCQIIDEDDRQVRLWLAAYKDFRSRRHTFERLLLENYVSQMTVFWRRELMERVGLLDESLHYTFDYDLWLRFAKEEPPLFMEQALAAFRWHAGSKSGSGFERQFSEDYAVFLRHAPPSSALRLRKRLRSWRIVLAYRLLAALRRGS